MVPELAPGATGVGETKDTRGFHGHSYLLASDDSKSPHHRSPTGVKATMSAIRSC